MWWTRYVYMFIQYFVYITCVNSIYIYVSGPLYPLCVSESFHYKEVSIIALYHLILIMLQQQSQTDCKSGTETSHNTCANCYYMVYTNDTHTGDLLSGVIGTMTAWSNMQKTEHCDSKSSGTIATTSTPSVEKLTAAAAKDNEKQKVNAHTHR
jgi:hypothetical protein